MAPAPAPATAPGPEPAEHFFTGKIPPGTIPGTQLQVTVPPGSFMAGSTLMYIVPAALPADGIVQIPIRPEDVMGAAAAPAPVPVGIRMRPYSCR